MSIVVVVAIAPVIVLAQSHEEYVEARAPIRPLTQIGVDPQRYDSIGWTPNYGPVSEIDARAGNHAVRTAVAAQDIDGIQKLLESMPSTGRDSVALMQAIDNGCVTCVKLLLGAGADPNFRCAKRLRPLTSAIVLGREEIAMLLINAGAYIEAQGKDRATPLLDAARFNRARIARHLMAAGADADVTDRHGRPPVTVAAERGHLEVLEALLAAGARPDALDKDGRPALYWAVYRKRRDAIRMLLAYGAQRGTIAVDLY